MMTYTEALNELMKNMDREDITEDMVEDLMESENNNGD